MIALLVPSRGRPDQLAAMWATAIEMADDPANVRLVARLDHDDPQRDLYPAVDADGLCATGYIVGPRMVLSECWNECYDMAVLAGADIFMHCADDIRFRSPGWDTLVTGTFHELSDRIAFVHGRDGIHDQALGTHGFLSREWVEAVGHFVPPYFSSDYNDTWLNEVADKIGRRFFLPQLTTEHLHPLVGKGEMDLTHQERIARGARDQVDTIWAETAHLRRIDAEKLRRAIDRAAA